MDKPPPRPGVAGSDEHYHFVERTDRRNLKTQLKNLVALAQEVATEDLYKRREQLRKLLDSEERMYEEEFANRVKARIESEIKERKDNLIQIKEQNAERDKGFVEKKRIQQAMNCCYEVREALRQKEREEVRITQEQQIVEKERETARQRELDRYWLRVQQINLEREDERQRNENCLKEWRRDQVRHVLAVQLEEREAKLEEERKEKAAEVERINNLLEELRLEELNRNQSVRAEQATQYRRELLCMMEAKRREREKEDNERAEEHRQLMRDIAREEAEAADALARAKCEHKKTLLDYIAYVRRMRDLEAGMEQMRNDRIDDLARVDICTKRNIAEVARRKAEAAAKCYAELRRQVCEQYERQKQEGIERRENKILENRFASPDIPPEVIKARKIQLKADLDRQILENQRIRAEEEEKYKGQLLRAIDDPEYCRELALEYIRDGVDYLEPHPNWLILLDPCREHYFPKGKAKQHFHAEGTRIKEPLLPALTCMPTRAEGPCAVPSKYIGPTMEPKPLTETYSVGVSKPCDFAKRGGVGKDLMPLAEGCTRCVMPCGCALRGKRTC